MKSLVGQRAGKSRLCLWVCCWRYKSQTPVAWGKNEPRDLKFRPVQVLLLLKEPYLFLFCQILLEAIYLHISQEGKTSGHTGVNHFWKWQTAFENKSTSPYWRKEKKINFSNVPVKGLYSRASSFWKAELFCGVTLKSRTHTHTDTHKTKKHLPFVLIRGCAVIIYRFW